MKSTAKAILYTTLVPAIALVPTAGVFAQITPGGTTSSNDVPYSLEQITHTFGIMDTYTTFDENKIITFDTAAATRDNVSELNIRIALDFIAHSNDMMATLVAGPTGTVNELDSNTALHREIDEFEEGKFRNLFGASSAGPVGQVMTHPSVATHGPTIPLVGESGIQVDMRSRPNNMPATACGNYGYHNHHPDNEGARITFSSPRAAWAGGVLDGFHRVPVYASFAYGLDYAMVDTDVGRDLGNCNNGEFRMQKYIKETRSEEWLRSEDGPEPNPEVFAYDWPATWWGPYVLVWHYHH